MGPLTDSRWSLSPAAEDAAWIRVEEASAVAAARRRVTALVDRLGFTAERQAQIALAVSEAASNLHKHAINGMLTVRITRTGSVASIELVCVDSGPGMADVPSSARDGYSTTGTLGIGLGAIFRLADVSDMHSLPRRGTVLTARFIGDGPLVAAPYSGLTRPKPGEQVCGDAYAVHWGERMIHVMLCDGLGHGPLAAAASYEAVLAFQQADLVGGPAELLRHVHRRLGGTRGGAVSIAAVDRSARQVRYAGLGNVAGWIVDPDGRRGMISTPGIAGHQARGFREHSYPLPADGMVVLHSDGLSERWKAADYPGLLGRHPMLMAGTLLRDAGVRNDDGCVVAIGGG
jgi:anti-sigma regulatory factor (Ser/Thr protein kinase)